MTVLMLGLLENIKLVLLVLQRAPQLVVCHEAGHDVDGDRKDNRAVVFGGNSIESLKISQLEFVLLFIPFKILENFLT